MSQAMQRGNRQCGALIGGAVAAVFWLVVLPIELTHRIGPDPWAVYHIFALIAGVTFGPLCGAIIGLAAGVLAVYVAQIAEQFTQSRIVRWVVSPVVGAVVGALIVLVATRIEQPWSLPLPFLLIGGILPGLLGGIGGMHPMRTLIT